MLKEIESERTQLQETRARMEIAKTLQSKNPDDSLLSRVEVDAAVKYAEVRLFSQLVTIETFMRWKVSEPI